MKERETETESRRRKEEREKDRERSSNARKDTENTRVTLRLVAQSCRVRDQGRPVHSKQTNCDHNVAQTCTVSGKSSAADDIELLGRAGIQSGSSRSGNPVSRSVNVRTDGAASFLSFSFFSFLAYVTTRRRLLRRVCVRTNGSTRHGIYTARHESNRRDRR